MTDEEIVRLVQSGDRLAFVELHRRYYQRIWRYARRSAVDPDTASDIASEVFLRAYRNIDRFKIRRDGSFGAFLFRIATNLLADRARRQPKVQQVSIDEVQDLVEHVPSTEPVPLDRILQEERIARVRKSLARLPMSDRQIVLLSYEKGLSVKEIASIMGKPSLTAVTSHLHRALCKLRDMLSNDEASEHCEGEDEGVRKTEETGHSR
ncbi:MAG: RNA polymerase sigma factor [Armatimonadota bacterium]